MSAECQRIKFNGDAETIPFATDEELYEAFLDIAERIRHNTDTYATEHPELHWKRSDGTLWKLEQIIAEMRKRATD